MNPDQQPCVTALIDPGLRTTSFCLAVAHGSCNDRVGRGGIAHLLEHLLMAAPIENGASFSEFVERRGGHANAETGLDTMLYYAQVDADDAEQTATLLERAIGRPALDPALLDSEREVIRQELSAASADPADVVQDAFLADLFGDHALGRPVGGVLSELTAVTIDEVRAVHRDMFRTAPANLVVVGPRVPEPLRDAATASPVVTQRDSVPVVPAAPTPGARQPQWPTDEQFCWICCGSPSPRAGDPAAHAYRVLAKLLGSSPASLLYHALREDRGLSYSFQAWNRGYSDAGVWRLLAGVEPRNADAFLDIVRTLLAQLASHGPTPGDLGAARRQAAMSMVMDSDSPLQRARLVAQRLRAHPAGWSLDRELADIAAVSAADISHAAAAVAADLRVTVRPQQR